MHPANESALSNPWGKTLTKPTSLSAAPAPPKARADNPHWPRPMPEPRPHHVASSPASAGNNCDSAISRRKDIPQTQAKLGGCREKLPECRPAAPRQDPDCHPARPTIRQLQSYPSWQTAEPLLPPPHSGCPLAMIRPTVGHRPNPAAPTGRTHPPKHPVGCRDPQSPYSTPLPSPDPSPPFPLPSDGPLHCATHHPRFPRSSSPCNRIQIG